jgi:hypothetical protein
MMRKPLAFEDVPSAWLPYWHPQSVQEIASVFWAQGGYIVGRRTTQKARRRADPPRKASQAVVPHRKARGHHGD